MTDGLFYGTSGPPNAPVVLVGEAWGQEENAAKRPFVGHSGQELHRMLSEAGLDSRGILFTNVAAAQPNHNEMWRLFEPKTTSKSIKIGGLLPSDFIRSEVQRLYAQITSHPRKLVIACGNYALWALSSLTKSSILRESNRRQIPLELQTYTPSGIATYRGSMLYCQHHLALDSEAERLQATPLLPIIHPAAILRQWSQRAPTVHDLRARVPMALASDWRPIEPPTLLHTPNFPEAKGILSEWLRRLDRMPFELSADIETARGLITCIGFADSTTFSMCIPFINKAPEGFGSWWTLEQEAELIRVIRRLFFHPNLRLIGQNFIYDTQYIQRFFGVQPKLYWDTMLAQNVLFPGTPKDLGYLSSLYCQYHWYWKEDAKEWNTKGSLDDLLRYNCVDNLRTYEIAQSQKNVMRSSNMEPQMAFKMRMNDLCLRMMNRGVRIDTNRRSQLLSELMLYSHRIASELEEIVPQSRVGPEEKTRWYNSAKQTAFLFYNQFAFSPVLNPKTGNPTVGKLAYPILRRKYPEFSGLFNRLDDLGSLDNTIQVMNSELDFDGRMRCSYNPGGTETHRLSSSTNAFGGGTNLQNLTKGEEDE